MDKKGFGEEGQEFDIGQKGSIAEEVFGKENPDFHFPAKKLMIKGQELEDQEERMDSDNKSNAKTKENVIAKKLIESKNPEEKILIGIFLNQRN